MFQDAFIKLDTLECETIMEEIGPSIQGGDFKADNVTILGQPLSFYPGYRFLDVANHNSVPAARRFVIYKPGDNVVLNWTNEPIYALNEKAPIALDENNVVDYVRFFFTYIKGRHGRFIVCENIDDILWREDPPPAARQAMGKIIKPVTLVAANDDGSYTLDVCMMFKNALFKARVDVAPNGETGLSQEELLVEDMPVLDDMFGQ